MYSLSFSCSRLGRKISPTQIIYMSKFTCREFNKDSMRVSTTTVFHQASTERKEYQKRPFSTERLRAIGAKDISVQVQNIISQSKDILQKVKLSDLSAAPHPAFWYGFAGLLPFVLPDLTFLIFGYSHFLAKAQLLYGATICSFLGGVKWGHTLPEKSGQEPTWENLGFAVMPQLVAWAGLLFPPTLGFLFVSGGLLSAAYIDLISPYYPPWFKALRLCLTLPAVLFLLLTWLMSIFH